MYKKKLRGWMKHFDFLLLDLICSQIAFIIAYNLKFNSINPYVNTRYSEIALALCFIDIVASSAFNSFKGILRRGNFVELIEMAKKTLIVELALSGYMFITKSGAEYSRAMYLTMGIVYLVVGYIFRVLRKIYLKKIYIKKHKRRMFIVANKDNAEEVIDGIRKNAVDDIEIVGMAIMSEDMTGETINGVSVVANENTVAEYVCREWIDEVFVKYPANGELPQKLINQFDKMGIIVHIGMVSIDDIVERKRFVEKVGNHITITSSMNYASWGQLFIKRAIDIVGGLIGTFITGILCIIVGPIIYISSPGPIFFNQERVGMNGKKFKIYKFRSMYMDAEERKKELAKQNRVKDGMMFKLDFDPRIIGSKQLPDGTVKKGIGNFIRDFSIDEFPQFFNVLKGDMSIVGTRPPTVDEWDKYELHHRARLAAKPGITGMWQVSGRSNITDFEQVVKLDTMYISEWSLSLDIKIMLKTILVVFKKEGSM